ncbi:hypothetical protein BaRGS_00011634 [Batillaria attramentaria]|uniref:Intraflagellar transport protein 46 homolog n=1 Tax=Batillaria attramentaria TaxID=370345 RepID=A0ABD0LCD7_9CAEN
MDDRDQMLSDSDEETNAQIHQNQPYDESLDVPDAEEIASTYSPTPRVPNPSDRGFSRGNTPPHSGMSEEMDDPYDDKPPQKARKKAAEQAAESPDPGVAQETQSLLPKVALDGSKAKAQGMSESLPQLAPKPGMQQRMAQQGQMMPRMPQQAPGGQQRQQMPILMPQITPQMRAQQQQQAMMMRARGPQQMFPGMNPAMVQAARQMQMQRMAMQRFRHPAPPQARHDIAPIIGRGRLRLDGVGPGEGEILPRAFGTPRDALPDIAGVKKVARAYDPAEFENLSVTAEIKELFQYITRYTPQSIELDHKLKPFIPDFIPSVGDIDAFIKIPRPDQKPDTLGLTVLDEPCAKQSDPTVLDLQLRAISKQTTAKTLVVKSLENAEKNPRAIENWIESIRELHRSKPPPNVHYSRNMPDIDTLMQEWPPEFEELLKEVSLPTADLDCDLGQFTEIICSVLDIPVYKNSSHHNEKIQALHVLFTLYSEFKNSQHFQSLAANNQLDNTLKDGSGGPGDSLLL